MFQFPLSEKSRLVVYFTDTTPRYPLKSGVGNGCNTEIPLRSGSVAAAGVFLEEVEPS